MANGEKKSKLQLKVLLGFGVALTAVAIAAMINFTSLNRLLSAVETISEPDYKLICLKQLLTDLSDLEGDVRTYTLTHDENYLNAYHGVADSIGQRIASLKKLTSDNDKQSVLTDSIERLVEERIILFNLFIEKRKNEFAAKLSVPETGIKNEKTPEQKPVVVTNVPPPPPAVAKPEKKESWLSRNFGSKKKKKNQNEEVVAVPAEVIDSLNVVADETDSVNDQVSITELNTILEREKEKLNEQVQGWSLDELVLLQQDKLVMDKIRSAINLLEKDEEVIAMRQTNEAATVAHDSTMIISVITSLGILSILFFLYLILRDISKSNRLKKQLIEERKRAEKLAKVKEEFLANMSHEIRTPLNAIVGFTEQLAKEETGETQRNYVRAIHHSAEYLSSLVNQVLSFSKIESGKLKAQEVAFDFYQLIREVFETFRIKASEKSTLFSYSIEEMVPRYVMGDPIICRQILINLVSNAIKFTEKGSVSISCSAKEPMNPDNDSVELVMQVKDTGIGIAPEMQDKIFEEFTQAENELSRKYEGTGLGLTITKKLSALLGGNVEVNSAVGSGSVFTVTLPFKLATAPGEDHQLAFLPDAGLKNKSVLIVDDEEMNILLAQTILTSWGMKTDATGSGRQALEKLYDFKGNGMATPGMIYDLVLLDIQMPGMSGTEVVAAIRSSTDERIRHMPVIALTANVYMEHLKEDATIGFDEVLVKPFKERDLYEKIVNVLKPENMNRNGVEFPNGKEVVSEEGLFSLKYLEKTSGANREFEIKMLELFIRNNTVHLAALKKGVAEKDWDAIYRIAHKMIPQFRYLEIGKTERKLKLLEELTGEIKNLEKIPALVEEISAETAQILLLLSDEVGKLIKKNGQLEETEDGMIVDHEKTR